LYLFLIFVIGLPVEILVFSIHPQILSRKKELVWATAGEGHVGGAETDEHFAGIDGVANREEKL
jgi:hypothetical protein